MEFIGDLLTFIDRHETLIFYISIFETQGFKYLFEFAEEQPDGMLPIPIVYYSDDFATGCPIPMMQDYISIFREKGISVILLLQSESQLISMYGADAATTIKNPCDSHVFLECNDLETARNVSQMVDKPLQDILHMKIGTQILFRRGSKPVIGPRYNIMENKLYQQVTAEYEREIERAKAERGEILM